MKVFVKDLLFTLPIFFLVLLSISVLRAIVPDMFPSYFVYIVLALGAFLVFANLDFEVIRLFSKHLYIISILLLIVTLIIGQVTRGTVRWIPIGSFSFQPAEIVRPFLILFFADYLAKRAFNFKHILKTGLLFLLPVVLILIQPSLSIAILLAVGFVGVLLANDFDKKYLLLGIGFFVVCLPMFWFILRPYQRERILNFATPENDPQGAGYNSIQSMIAVGSGKITGRTLGKGVQTQLAFLPEKQTDFIFAATAEELGFIGAFIMLVSTFVVLWRITYFMENSQNPYARVYLSGIFLTFFAQVIVHVGMNMGLLPVAGLPYPLVSAGGSSLLGTAIGLGIALSAYKKS